MDKNPYFRQGAQVNRFSSRSGSQGASTQYAGDTRYGNDYAQQYSPDAYREQLNAQNAYLGAQSAGRASAEQAFASAATQQTTMTYRDALNKTGALLGIAVIAGALTVSLVPLALQMPIAIVATIAAFVVGMVIAFKRMVSPGLSIAYAALEGVALGAITGAFELMLPGIAVQAILATTVIVGVTWGLHYSGKVRTTSKGMRFVLIAAIGGIVFSFVNMFLSLFGVINLRTNVSILGIPLGIFIGIAMILVAAYMLVADFEMVQYAVNNGAPKVFAWTCAIGIVMTIIWIYVEVLRVIAIFRSE
ncbi:MAG: Bax inhibitor-1/YccA family protein [Actinomycetaceae bacterium]|nr:Bax inhibitor-1/YccA family protein [Arcanobacterium sp.]MDD7505845.1 Bax inhibitor-1/YccA family protein [Actinomycetaceae bacterium]MDY6143771.1 Bax inhibitor-1/YccA family protein [Arcanobacterium sp.]